MRDHADDADEDEGERGVVRPCGRDRRPQGDRADDVERAEDRRGDPAERDQMNNPDHTRVIEEAGYAARIARHLHTGQQQGDVRDAEVQDWQQARWQAAGDR